MYIILIGSSKSIEDPQIIMTIHRILQMRILIIYEYYFDYIEDSQKVFEHPQYSENVQIKLRICRILRILEDPADKYYKILYLIEKSNGITFGTRVFFSIKHLNIHIHQNHKFLHYFQIYMKKLLF